MDKDEALAVIRSAAMDYADYLANEDDGFEKDRHTDEIKRIDDALDYLKEN